MSKAVIRVSSLGQCARRVFYDRTGVPPEISEESERVMALGHLLESLRKRELRKEGRRVYSPQATVRFGVALGHIDGFLKTPEGPVLWEAKSTTGFSLAKWRAEGLPRRIAWQIHAYMQGLSDILGEPVTKTLLETIDRTSGEVFSWTYERDEAITKDAMERAEFLADALEKNAMPDREFDGNDSECAYCPFRSTCRPITTPKDSTKETHDASSWPGWAEAVEVYLAGQQLKEDGEGLVARAKDIILDGLTQHSATRATAKGFTAVWSQVETSRFDAKALQKSHPELHAQFIRPSTYTRLQVSK